jgi:hypothetical protein
MHVSLYIPLLLWSYVVAGLRGFRHWRNVLVLLKAMLMSVFEKATTRTSTKN